MPKHPIQLEARRRVAALLAIPVLVGLSMWLVVREASRRDELVKHALVVELSLERLTSELTRAESAQRGYLLTGEERYLDPYRAAVSAARREADTLGSITVTQHGAAVRMKPLVEMRLEQFESVLASFRSGGLDSSKASIDRGKELMDSIQSVAGEMLREEDRLLQARQTAFSNSSRLLSWSLAGGYGLIVIVVGSLYRNVVRYSHQTAQAQQHLSLLNTELDQRVRERTALLEAREELLKTFVKYVPAAVAMMDREMRYVQVSDRWCSDYSLDSSQILGRCHYEVFPDLPERWKQIHRRSLAGETLRVDEDRWDRSGGQTIWLQWEIRPWGNAGGRPEGILIFSEDISRRKQIEEMLRESEATTRALLETAAQAILAADHTGRIVSANRMASNMFGRHPQELVGRSIDTLIPARLRGPHALHFAEFVSHPKTRPMGAGLELFGLRSDGSEFPIEVSLSCVETSRGPLAVSFVSDITGRKQAETALRNSEQQLRALAGSLLTAQEDERRRLARELHDDVTQRLAFLSIELGKLAGEIPESLEQTRARIRALQSQTLRASTEVRRLSHGLHSSVIEDFGLSVALEEFCDEFARTQGIHVKFEGLVEDSALDAASATCLYRVAQESLRNAVNHGHATQIQVELVLSADRIQLQVTDNGAGFSSSGARAGTGLGVISMRERVRLVGGMLALSSEPGQGTRVTAWVPLRRTNHETDPYSAG